ncbi:uncharacterized protein BDR25DRAFT_318611 [Lindgomyces ingoldianus]|uniref:Uncharacterized protein n=1 Tax=Lindgomyces ingoldianus TaxID=673940 RepID=A0ACB6QEQ7_9PLEO|nr:uncharacterized protein BDR25DRAFT_318611 [Lindgomyces ingoldianus]KAF2465371.1 hypothetical protein BDR25DRAFT_318611 [Lindgomyces ingoldianus]
MNPKLLALLLPLVVAFPNAAPEAEPLPEAVDLEARDCNYSVGWHWAPSVPGLSAATWWPKRSVGMGGTRELRKSGEDECNALDYGRSTAGHNFPIWDTACDFRYQSGKYFGFSRRQNVSMPESPELMSHEWRDGIAVCRSRTEYYKSLCKSLYTPRLIIFSFPHCTIGDKVLANLSPYLSVADIILDCGNEHYASSERRQKKYAPSGIHYIECGVSDGYQATRAGSSICPGGGESAISNILPLSERVAVKYEALCTRRSTVRLGDFEACTGEILCTFVQQGGGAVGRRKIKV